MVEADSLGYLSPEGMVHAITGQRAAGPGFCLACFSGAYPVDIDCEQGGKYAFENLTSGRTSGGK